MKFFFYLVERNLVPLLAIVLPALTDFQRPKLHCLCFLIARTRVDRLRTICQVPDKYIIQFLKPGCLTWAVNPI
jgi:hypothetical protein